MDYPLDEAIMKADKQVLLQICVAMRVPREGSQQTLIKNLEPKLLNIQKWVEEYRQVNNYQPTQDHCGRVDWTAILKRTWKQRKDREKSD